MSSEMTVAYDGDMNAQIELPGIGTVAIGYLKVFDIDDVSHAEREKERNTNKKQKSAVIT
jgi:hypothetical protein